jgi:hypothetical protein
MCVQYTWCQHFCLQSKHSQAKTDKDSDNHYQTQMCLLAQPIVSGCPQQVTPEHDDVLSSPSTFFSAELSPSGSQHSCTTGVLLLLSTATGTGQASQTAGQKSFAALWPEAYVRRKTGTCLPLAFAHALSL